MSENDKDLTEEEYLDLISSIQPAISKFREFNKKHGGEIIDFSKEKPIKDE